MADDLEGAVSRGSIGIGPMMTMLPAFIAWFATMAVLDGWMPNLALHNQAGVAFIVFIAVWRLTGHWWAIVLERYSPTDSEVAVRVE